MIELTKDIIVVRSQMKQGIERALKADRLIDITTIGRKTGKPRRIEIAFHYFDEKIYISGLPGRRGWFANLLAHPEFTFHLKQSENVDIPAIAIPIQDISRRKEILTRISRRWRRSNEIEAFLESSPLIEVELSDSL